MIWNRCKGFSKFSESVAAELAVLFALGWDKRSIEKRLGIILTKYNDKKQNLKSSSFKLIPSQFAYCCRAEIHPIAIYTVLYGNISSIGLPTEFTADLTDCLSYDTHSKTNYITPADIRKNWTPKEAGLLSKLLVINAKPLTPATLRSEKSNPYPDDYVQFILRIIARKRGIPLIDLVGKNTPVDAINKLKDYPFPDTWLKSTTVELIRKGVFGYYGVSPEHDSYVRREYGVKGGDVL